MSKINVSWLYSAITTRTDTDTLFANHFEPYSWLFYVKGANQCVGHCFCCTPLKECPVLQYALKDKHLSANLCISFRGNSPVVCDGKVHSFYDFSFTFISTVNPAELRQKLMHIRNKCSSMRLPWANTKESTKVIKSR